LCPVLRDGTFELARCHLELPVIMCSSANVERAAVERTAAERRRACRRRACRRRAVWPQSAVERAAVECAAYERAAISGEGVAGDGRAAGPLLFCSSAAVERAAVERTAAERRRACSRRACRRRACRRNFNFCAFAISIHDCAIAQTTPRTGRFCDGPQNEGNGLIHSHILGRNQRHNGPWGVLGLKIVRPARSTVENLGRRIAPAKICIQTWSV